MRGALLALAGLALASCASFGGGASTSTALTPADNATRLITGESVTLTTQARGGGSGQDPHVTLTMRLADGRAFTFDEANHAPHDVMAQAPGGPLAQAMRIFDETARPTLYRPRDIAGIPLCHPNGPALLGVHTDASGAVSIIGLREGFGFEERDGATHALPVSPEIVCARLQFTRAG